MQETMATQQGQRLSVAGLPEILNVEGIKKHFKRAPYLHQSNLQNIFSPGFSLP